MNMIEAPLFFQRGKAKELNDSIFTNTGCFIFLKIVDFPFTNYCYNYRQALYSLIIDSYVLFHDYGREFLIAFSNISHTTAPSILENLVKYRVLLTHSQFEPEIQIMNSFSRLITTKDILSIEDFYVKLLNATDSDYESAYNELKKELNTFYSALSVVSDKSIKIRFCNYRPRKTALNTFQLSFNEALIKPILQAVSGDERPTYINDNVTYCQNGKVNIFHFADIQKNIIKRFNNNRYSTPDEIYPDFRDQVINAVNPPQQSSALLLSNNLTGL